MSMFKKGFKVAREQEEKNNIIRENIGRKLYDFFLRESGEEADVVFLTEEPINFEQHDINERGQFKSYVCSGDNCPICESGDEPKYKGAFLIWDKRPFEYVNKEGKTVTYENGAIRVYARGVKDVTQLDRISTKYGLAGRMITIIRNGKSQNTSYTFERGEMIDFTEDEIRAVLPEKLRDDYDGTQESLYKILENQLMMRTKEGISEDYNDEVEDSGEEVIEDKIMGADEPVKTKKSLKKKKSMFKSV